MIFHYQKHSVLNYLRRPAAFGCPRTPSRRSYRAPPEVWLSPRALAPRAPFLRTDSLLRVLVARNRWLLARPAACATGLAPPAGVRSPRAGCSGSFLERARHADQLMLGASGSSRHWSRSALVSARPALVALGPFLSALVTRTCWYSARPVAHATGLAPRWSPLCALVARSSLCALVCMTQSPGGSSVGLALRWSPPLAPSVAARSPARTNSTGIRLLSSVPHWWLLQF